MGGKRDKVWGFGIWDVIGESLERSLEEGGVAREGGDEWIIKARS